MKKFERSSLGRDRFTASRLKRLWYLCGGVEAAVPAGIAGRRWRAATLSEMNPRYWRPVVPPGA
jgi:hypothetical protein